MPIEPISKLHGAPYERGIELASSERQREAHNSVRQTPSDNLALKMGEKATTIQQLLNDETNFETLGAQKEMEPLLGQDVVIQDSIFCYPSNPPAKPSSTPGADARTSGRPVGRQGLLDGTTDFNTLGVIEEGPHSRQYELPKTQGLLPIASMTVPNNTDSSTDNSIRSIGFESLLGGLDINHALIKTPYDRSALANQVAEGRSIMMDFSGNPHEIISSWDSMCNRDLGSSGLAKLLNLPISSVAEEDIEVLTTKIKKDVKVFLDKYIDVPVRFFESGSKSFELKRLFLIEDEDIWSTFSYNTSIIERILNDNRAKQYVIPANGPLHPRSDMWQAEAGKNAAERRKAHEKQSKAGHIEVQKRIAASKAPETGAATSSMANGGHQGGQGNSSGPSRNAGHQSSRANGVFGPPAQGNSQLYSGRQSFPASGRFGATVHPQPFPSHQPPPSYSTYASPMQSSFPPHIAPQQDPARPSPVYTNTPSTVSTRLTDSSRDYGSSNSGHAATESTEPTEPDHDWQYQQPVNKGQRDPNSQLRGHRDYFGSAGRRNR